MSTPRQHARVTRSTYARIARQFLECTVDRRGIRHLRRQFTASLPPRALILDVGCGPGCDSDHFRGEGHRVVGIDLSLGMLQLAREEYGPAAQVQADMRQLPCDNKSDGIWACASMLHLDRQDFSAALAGFWSALKPGGLLCLSLKEGQGEEWDTRYGSECPRWFTYWREADVDDHLRRSDFEIFGSIGKPGGSRIRRLARRR